MTAAAEERPPSGARIERVDASVALWNSRTLFPVDVRPQAWALHLDVEPSDSMSDVQPGSTSLMGNTLPGKKVLVTGASGGIGRATAQLLAENGARVAALARRAPQADRARATRH